MNRFNSLIFAIYLPTFLLAFCRGMLIPVLPLYAGTFESAYWLIGIALAGQGLGTLMGDVPSGLMIERIGRKRSMIIGIITMALGTLTFALVQSIYQLMILGVLVGLGNSLWNLSRHAYLADAAPVAGRGKAIAIFGGINRMGALAGPLLGGWLASNYGLTMPFIIYALVAAGALVFPFYFVERRGYRPPVKGTLGEHIRHLGTVSVENGRMLVSAGSGQLFAQSIRSGRDIIIPLFAADVIGLDVAQIGQVIAIAGFIDSVLFPVSGYLMDNYGRKWAYVPSFLIQAMAMALIPFSTDFFTLALTTGLLGFGNGIGSGTMMTLGADLAPTDSRGEFLGVWRLIGDGGQVVGPTVVGGMAQALGLVMATYGLAGIGLLAAIMLGTLVPETLIKNRKTT